MLMLVETIHAVCTKGPDFTYIFSYTGSAVAYFGCHVNVLRNTNSALAFRAIIITEFLRQRVPTMQTNKELCSRAFIHRC